jgi:heptosyltransferase-3
MTGLSAPKSLVVIPPRFIGDTVLTTPLLDSLRHAFPNSRLAVLTSAAAAPLLDGHPSVDRVLVDGGSPRARISQLRGGGFDTAIVLRRSFSAALICRLAGIRQVLGYRRQRLLPPLGYRDWGLLLSRSLPYQPLRTERHEVQSYLDFLAFWGVPPLPEPRLSLPADARELRQTLRQEKLSLDGLSIAVLHASSASHGKAIALEKFVPAIQAVERRGFHWIAIGVEADRAQYEQLSALSGVSIANLAGRIPIRQTVALLQQADLLLSLDSGPIHLAAAAGTPRIVGIYGPTNVRQWAPWHPEIRFVPVYNDLDCRPCVAKICEHNRCREDLTAEQIVNAVRQVLSEQPVPTWTGLATAAR